MRCTCQVTQANELPCDCKKTKGEKEEDEEKEEEEQVQQSSGLRLLLQRVIWGHSSQLFVIICPSMKVHHEGHRKMPLPPFISAKCGSNLPCAL